MPLREAVTADSAAYDLGVRYSIPDTEIASAAFTGQKNRSNLWGKTRYAGEFMVVCRHRVWRDFILVGFTYVAKVALGLRIEFLVDNQEY